MSEGLTLSDAELDKFIHAASLKKFALAKKAYLIAVELKSARSFISKANTKEGQRE